MSKKEVAKATPDQQSEEKPSRRDSLDLREELEKQISPIVQQSQKDQVVERVMMVIARSEAFSGPIAHPKHLREYEDILSGSAERILVMAESAQLHNQKMDGAIVQHQIDDTKRGVYLGFAGLVFIVALAFIAGTMGNNVLAGLLLTSAVLGSVAHFIRGRIIAMNKSAGE